MVLNRQFNKGSVVIAFPDIFRKTTGVGQKKWTKIWLIWV